MDAYVDDLPNVVDVHAISAEGIRIGADPLGGASVDYWGAIAERHNLELTVVNPLVDATWRFMTLDTDGKIRMDCSSPNAMASLIANRDNVPDRDRQRRRLRPARHRHARRRAAQPEPLPRGGDRVPVHQPAGLAGVDGGRQDRGQLVDHRPGGRRAGPQAGRGAGRASSGSSTDCSAALSVSAARRARGRRSCAVTGRRGPPTRTASSWRCWRRRSSR